MGLRFSPGTRRRHDLHAPGIEDGRQASRSATLLRRTNPKHEHGDALFRGRVSRSVAAPASEPDGTTTDRVEHDHGIWRRRPLIHIRGGEPLGVVRRGPRVHKSHGPPKPSPDKSRRGKSIFSVQWLSSDRGNGPLSSTKFPAPTDYRWRAQTWWSLERLCIRYFLPALRTAGLRIFHLNAGVPEISDPRSDAVMEQI